MVKVSCLILSPLWMLQKQKSGQQLEALFNWHYEITSTEFANMQTVLFIPPAPHDPNQLSLYCLSEAATCAHWDLLYAESLP